jgi:hypothetical protein
MVGVSIVQPAKLAHPVMVPSNPTRKGEHSVQCALLALNVPEALSSTVIGALIRPLEFVSTKCTSPAYRIAFLKMHSGTFRKHFRFSSHEHFIGQGMVHETRLHCFPLAVCYRTNASRQSTTPAIVRKRGDVFARCSVRFIAGAEV